MNTSNENQLTLETVIQHRNETLKVAQSLKEKFIGGTFTYHELLKYYSKTSQEADILITILGKFGFLRSEEGQHTTKFELVFDYKKQYENISFFLQQKVMEVNFFTLSQCVIQELIDKEPTLKIVDNGK